MLPINYGNKYSHVHFDRNTSLVQPQYWGFIQQTNNIRLTNSYKKRKNEKLVPENDWG